MAYRRKVLRGCPKVTTLSSSLGRHLLDSVCVLLASCHATAGVYTKSDTCAAFLRQAERRGLVWFDRGAPLRWAGAGRGIEERPARARYKQRATRGPKRHVSVMGRAVVW